ncbi:predicted protein [Botrytis cinerea T4]|uniref:Uncharacterized protein n=1 Tax=Botryotinia fuckeliana (strain T4) TaxID=999810 RepID=G2Y888_BOTF4|nr:predicted protein [Botrytis cinerea T4]
MESSKILIWSRYRQSKKLIATLPGSCHPFEIKDLDTAAKVATDTPWDLLQMHPRKEMQPAAS